jgi:asparagine synthase (glutamine-hydrolysing)
MNFLAGTIPWNRRTAARRTLPGDVDSQGVCLTVRRAGIFAFDEESCHDNPTANVRCALIGCVTNLIELQNKYALSEISDVRFIERLYALRGIALVAELDGDFVLVIVDGNCRTCFVCHGPYGASLPIYYGTDDGAVEFSTCLRHVISRLDGQRGFNAGAVREFLFGAAVVPNSSTLVNRVSKLLPGTYLAVDVGSGTVVVRNVRRVVKRLPAAEAERRLLPSIETTVRALYGSLRDPRPSLALTSGYDTNYLLHLLTQLCPHGLDAYTIGGDRINEAPAAARVLEQYSQVRHHVRMMEPGLLQFFPDIVWRLEGYVCHTGVFLQYELARLLRERNCGHVMLGECADQVLDAVRDRIPLFRRLKNYLQASALGMAWNAVRGIESSEYACLARLSRQAGPSRRVAEYDVALDYILKKSGLLLNSFEIHPLYPFLSTKTGDLGRSLGESNRKKKAYIAQLEAVLPDAAWPHIGHASSGTDITFLCQGNAERILASVAEREVVAMLPRRVRRIISRAPGLYGAFVLKVLFVQLFHELFLTGSHDDQFAESHCPHTLADMLGW